jgi:osmotically-inducible protein OsmY
MIRALLVVAAAGYVGYKYFSRLRAQRVQDQASDYRAKGIADNALSKRVRKRLAGLLTDIRRVHVSADRGTVTLRGSVPADERDRALNAALSVPGVLQLVNQLEVQAQPESPAIERGPMKSGMASGAQPPGEAKGSDPDLGSDPGFLSGR